MVKFYEFSVCSVSIGIFVAMLVVGISLTSVIAFQDAFAEHSNSNSDSKIITITDETIERFNPYQLIKKWRSESDYLGKVIQFKTTGDYHYKWFTEALKASTSGTTSNYVEDVNGNSFLMPANWTCYGSGQYCFDKEERKIVVEPIFDNFRVYTNSPNKSSSGTLLGQLGGNNYGNLSYEKTYGTPSYEKTSPILKSYIQKNDFSKSNPDLLKDSISLKSKGFDSNYKIPPPPLEKSKIDKPTIKKIEPLSWWCFWCR